MARVILVVEDNPVNQRLVEAVLKAEGYDVRLAPDAMTALSLLEQFRPDLILTDVQMPGMDGVALTRVVKAKEELRRIPVVILTAYAMRGDRERFLAAGADGYIAKPIDIATFPGEIARFFGPLTSG
ncbi:MAG: response regulator [Thermoplasmatota archaeon]